MELIQPNTGCFIKSRFLQTMDSNHKMELQESLWWTVSSSLAWNS